MSSPGPGRLAGTCGPSRLEGAGPGRAGGGARGGSVQNVHLEGHRAVSQALAVRPGSRWQVPGGRGEAPGGAQSRMSVSKGTR